MDLPTRVLENEFERAIAARAPVDLDIAPIAEPHAPPASREHHFHALLDALPAAVYTTDAVGRITYYNNAATALWGRRPVLGSSEWCGSWKLFWPDGRPMRHDECPMAVALKEERTVRGLEAACERPDGTRVSFIPYPTPLHDDRGRLAGAVNMLVDISERKRAEERQALLLRELHHRVKNTLATVQAIVGSTARASNSIDEFKAALNGRIGALARTHLLLSEECGAATFADILHNELDAFDDSGRIALNGPDVALPPRLAVALSMAVHELATNAAKYGALSSAGGKLEVTWTIAENGERRMLTIDWVEAGGPPVVAPCRHGFGLRLLDFVLPGQIQARTRIDYPPEGLRVQCVVPIPSESQAAA